MKNPTMLVLAILAGLLIAATTNAQDYERKSTITFEQFVEKVSGVSIPGFSARPLFDNGSEDEYQAAYVQGNDVFIITLEARHNPPVWSKGPYKLDGKDAEYVFMGGMGTLAIYLPETYSVLSIGSNKTSDKATLEQIARQTGFLQLTPTTVTVSWPGLVPEEYRIAGTLLEASEGEDLDTGIFSYQVRVTMVMSPLLKQSLYDLLGKYDGSEEMFVRFPDGTILNFPFESIDEIDDSYAKDSLIKFVYYIP